MAVFCPRFTSVRKRSSNRVFIALMGKVLRRFPPLSTKVDRKNNKRRIGSLKFDEAFALPSWNDEKITKEKLDVWMSATDLTVRFFYASFTS